MFILATYCSATSNLRPRFIITTCRDTSHCHLIRFSIRTSRTSAASMNSTIIEFCFTSGLRNACLKHATRNSNERDISGNLRQVYSIIRDATSTTRRVSSVTMMLKFFMRCCPCIITVPTRVITYRIRRRCVFYIFFQVDRGDFHRFLIFSNISHTTYNTNGQISVHLSTFRFTVHFK